MTSPQAAFPLRLTGELDPDVSRWQWLFKWLLAIPHFIVLFFLWIGFVVSTVVAGFSILFTGRYPRRIFDFNVGVLRWSWRVGFYSYSALGTDKYPPFSLADDPTYAARLEVESPIAMTVQEGPLIGGCTGVKCGAESRRSRAAVHYGGKTDPVAVLADSAIRGS